MPRDIPRPRGRLGGGHACRVRDSGRLSTIPYADAVADVAGDGDHSGSRHATDASVSCMKGDVRTRLLLLLLGLAAGLAVATLAVALLHRSDAPAYADPRDGTRVRHTRADPDLGYAAIPGRSVRARRTSGGRTLYDVVYTIGDDGWRVTPGSRSGPRIVFFGCSNTFGVGLDDGDTLPAQLARALDAPADVRNRSLHGWGPHQMVRLLETGRVRDDAPVVRAFYQSMPQHAARAAGRAPWDPAGPRYVADPGEALVRYVGPFHGPLFTLASRAVGRIGPLRRLRERWLYEQPPDDAEREKHARLVLRAAALVREQLGAPLTVLHWDDATDADERFLARLQEGGVDVVRVSSILPSERWEELSIPGDGHPSPTATALLAGALARRYGVPSAVASTTQAPSAAR